MAEDLALLDISPPVARLTLNRADARNALSIDLIRSLDARVSEIEVLAGADRPNVLVLSGAGRAFCAWMDLKAVMGDPEGAGQLLAGLGELTIRVRALPIVTVASVNGAAIGGGCGLTCVCDLSVTHADAKLGFPEVDLGLCPAVVAPWLVRKIGGGKARSVLLRGGLMSGADALEIGLVDRCVKDRDELDEAVEEIVAGIASGGAQALAATKGLLNEIDGSLDPAIIRRGAELSARIVSSTGAQRALRAKFSDA